MTGCAARVKYRRREEGGETMPAEPVPYVKRTGQREELRHRDPDQRQCSPERCRMHGHKPALRRRTTDRHGLAAKKH